MKKEQIHELFKDFIVTVRNGKAVVNLGYINAYGNNLQYSEKDEQKVISICKENNLTYEKKTTTEKKATLIRLYIEM